MADEKELPTFFYIVLSGIAGALVGISWNLVRIAKALEVLAGGK